MNVNKKLLNISVLCLIIYLLYQSSGLWISFINVLKKIFYPLLLSFLFAYAFYPITKWLRKNKISKSISILIVILTFLLIIILFLFWIFPLFYKEIVFILEDIITFLEQISYKYQININFIEKILMNNVNIIFENAGLISKLINSLLSIFSIVIIWFSLFIYLLIDMDEIRSSIGHYISKKNNEIYLLLFKIDKELKKYFISFGKVMFITLIEYTLSFLAIGHPNYIMLGFCASIASFIPCFGGIIVNVVASLTAYVIGKKLFIRTIILFLILSIIDSYIINPIIYGKNNKVKPIYTIIVMFISGTIFGSLGIIMSMPGTITIMAIIDFYKNNRCRKDL